MWYVQRGTGSIPIIIGRQMPHTTQSIRFTGCGNNAVNLLRYSLITSDGFIYYSIVFARKKKWWDRGPWSLSLNKTGFSGAVYHFVSQLRNPVRWFFYLETDNKTERLGFVGQSIRFSPVTESSQVVFLPRDWQQNWKTGFCGAVYQIFPSHGIQSGGFFT